MNCPNCESVMREIEYENVGVMTCDGCGGEFINSLDMALVVETREERFAPELLERMAECEPVFGVPRESDGRSLVCPACENPMDVINYAGDSGVCVDRCCACGGMWLDTEELEKVQVLMERWEDGAPEQVRAAAVELEETRRAAVERVGCGFTGSRFAFVNALINRFVDAA